MRQRNRFPQVAERLGERARCTLPYTINRAIKNELACSTVAKTWAEISALLGSMNY